MRQHQDAFPAVTITASPACASGRPSLKNGPVRGVSVEIEAMRQHAFRAMGYDEEEMPAKELLESLGRSEVAANLQLVQ